MPKLNILLTNDDSYDSELLHIVKEKLKEIGNVYVFAPKEVMSAKSCSCTLTRGLSVIKVKENEYIIDGTPSDCVNLGNYFCKKELGIHIDLVVSGCNKGENISYDTMYSGTIGACLEASKNHIASMAYSAPWGIDKLSEWVLPCFNYAFNNNLVNENDIVSFNFPLDFSKIDGIKRSIFEYRDDTHYYDFKDGLYFAKRIINNPKIENSEAYLFQNTHYISCLVLSNSIKKE